MNYIRTLIACFLCVSCLIATNPVLAEERQSYAEALNLLGMFSGTENGFELERTPTRSDALVMLIRLLGKEKEALTAIYPHPFSDTGWDEPYVSYGHHNALINGVSENCFGGGQTSSLKQYCAMLLRVLGYTEPGGDFTYENAVPFASLVLGEEFSDGEGFTRGKMAELTCYALNTRIKNSSLTLGQTLADDSVFSEQMLANARKCWEQTEEYSSTTILIYSIGSDLESQQGRLSNDLKEILNAAPKENCKVLLQTGGTLKYHNDYMSNEKAERFRVQGSTLQKTEGSISTGAAKAETLSDFIRWGKAEAPAQRYILVLWDHGYGIKGGFGADELNGRKTMKVSDICAAIEKANVFFDIIAFDACLMGTVETAFALRNYTKYLIASEDSTPACGLYYTTWIGALERNPSMSTQRLGRLILDSFTLHAGIEANIQTTLSMMKVSRANALIDKISLFKGDLHSLASNAELLGKNEGIFDQFDIFSVMGGVPEITASVQALAFEVRNSSGSSNYSGISLYVPSRKPEDAPKMIDELKKIGLNNTYLNVIFNGVVIER